jgi:transposase
MAVKKVHKKISHEERRAIRAKAIEIIRKGGSIKDAIAKTGVALSSLNTAAVEHGIILPPVSTKKEQSFSTKIKILKTLMDDKSRTMSVDTIANTFGVHPNIVYQVNAEARKVGIKTSVLARRI